MALTRHIFLIGFMGVGKSTVAGELQTKLSVPEIDTDAWIVAQEGMTIPEMFAQKGEDYFRTRETEFLEKLASREPCIVSCGGGMAMRPENVRLMHSQGEVVYLQAEPETIFEHVRHSTDRPLLNGHMNVEYIAELMGQRQSKYEAAATIRVKTDGLTPDAVAQKIIENLEKGLKK